MPTVRMMQHCQCVTTEAIDALAQQTVAPAGDRISRQQRASKFATEFEHAIASLKQVLGDGHSPGAQGGRATAVSCPELSRCRVWHIVGACTAAGERSLASRPRSVSCGHTRQILWPSISTSRCAVSCRHFSHTSRPASPPSQRPPDNGGPVSVTHSRSAASIAAQPSLPWPLCPPSQPPHSLRWFIDRPTFNTPPCLHPPCLHGACLSRHGGC